MENRNQRMNVHYMLQKFVIWLAILGFAATGIAQADSPVTLQLDSLLRTGKEQIYRLDFRDAERTFRFTQRQFPEQPHGYIFEAYISALVYSMDQSNDSLAEALNRQVSKALEVAEAFKDRDDKNPEAYFYLALGNGIDALYHVINRSFIKGYWSGRKTKSNLEKATQLDPQYYDAYFGLGLFHYYADLLPGMLKLIAGVLGFDGDRVLGRNEVYMAASRGTFFRIEGEFMYYSIGYFLEGEKSRSIRALKQLYRQYPTNMALGLIIAYHYRRSGYMEKCIEYCKQFDDQYSDYLPQLTNVRYYNIGVANYDLNRFEKADSLFKALENLPTRKSRYYRAAMNYYRGHIADLRFDRETAMAYYSKIPDEQQESYWFMNAAMHRRFPMDSLQYRFFVAENMLNSRQFDKSIAASEALKRNIDSGQRSTNPFLQQLVENLLARQYHYRRKMDEAGKLFASIYKNLDNVDDKYQQSWLLIHYGRYLRDAKQHDRAIEIFEQAGSLDDDFTKIICEREKFVTKRQQQNKSTEDDDEE